MSSLLSPWIFLSGPYSGAETPLASAQGQYKRQARHRGNIELRSIHSVFVMDDGVEGVIDGPEAVAVFPVDRGVGEHHARGGNLVYRAARVEPAYQEPGRRTGRASFQPQRAGREGDAVGRVALQAREGPCASGRQYEVAAVAARAPAERDGRGGYASQHRAPDRNRCSPGASRSLPGHHSGADREFIVGTVRPGFAWVCARLPACPGTPGKRAPGA